MFQAADEASTKEAEARPRFVAGGMMILGDDLGKPEARARVLRLFGNDEALAIARCHSPFRPVNGDLGARAGDAFVRVDGEGAYVALFNYDKASSVVRSLPLARLRLPDGAWTARNVLTGESHALKGALSVDLRPMDCALLRLSRNPLTPARHSAKKAVSPRDCSRRRSPSCPRRRHGSR